MHDLLIIGGGPAALTAAIYAARYKLDALVLADHIGGQIAEARDVENWPGIKNISGMELMDRFKEHARSLGGSIAQEEAKEVVKDEMFTVNRKHKAKAVLIASGSRKRKLEVPGEKEFLGRGVSYCATCDGAFFRDKKVGVVGGSDSAAVSALILAEFAEKVYILYRRSEIRAEPHWREKIEKNSRIEIIPNVNVKEIRGDKRVKSVLLDHGKEIELDGLFIEIGTVPFSGITEMLKVSTDDPGYIVVDDRQATDVQGVYAAGDVTTGSNNFRQVITACAEAAVAVRSIWEDLRKDG
ncbi:NAD(P)-binding protein [Candidatus Woesearchaeota archaeon]|nr:NAD(P)-binding protein [Candidatus Woesearchaeota archaeon]